MLSAQDSFDGRARDHTRGRQECYTVSAHENCASDGQAAGDLDPNLLVPWIEPTAHRGNRLDNAPFIGCLPLCLTSPLPSKRFWTHYLHSNSQGWILKEHKSRQNRSPGQQTLSHSPRGSDSQ